MITFRRFTILFFMILLGLNLWMILTGRYGGGLFREHAVAIYSTVLTCYFGISFAFAFLPCTGFHHPVICRGVTMEKKIALTFDDGPNPHFTPGVLAVLRQQNARATFFCSGKNCAENPGLLQQILQHGHLVGNHSYTHSPFFDLYSAGRIAKEITRTNRVIAQITGHTPAFFRPPYGVINPMVSRALRRTGMKTICWDIRSMDTIHRDPDKVLRKVIGQLHPGSIILLHDHTSFTTGHLENLITAIRATGFEIVPLDELLKMDAYVS